MGNITLLELHVPEGDIQIGPKSLRSAKAETELRLRLKPLLMLNRLRPLRTTVACRLVCCW